MDILKDSIEFIFSFALFINALLFIPQALRIFKEKAAEEVSLLTFLGFLLIQFTIVLHGIINRDYLLTAGYLFSMLTCGTVVALIVLYNKRQGLRQEIDPKEILKQLPGHVYCKNKEGVYLTSNANQWKDIGLAALSELKGKTDYDLFSVQEADRFRAADEEVMRTGKLKILEEETQIATGKATYYLSHKIPLKDKKNQIIGILGVSIDISDAKKKATERFEMLEKIIAMMPGHVYWVNTEGIYLGCNDNQAKSAGLSSRKEIIGRHNQNLPWNFSAGVLPEALDNINKKVIETRRPITIEEPALLQDGTEAIFLSNKVPLLNEDGKAIGMVGISIDITERKKAESALKAAKEAAEFANQAKTEFLSNMRHDLRTPFSGLLGMSDFIESQETDPEKKENLSCITQSAKALLDQLNEVFELVEVENGQLPIMDKEFDLQEVINNLYHMLLPSAKNKQLDFTLTKDNKLPQYVIGDRVRTQRILIHVIANAIKFTEKGYVTLAVKLIPESKREIVIRFTIADSGIGIPADKQDIIFERFNRLTSSYSGVYPGKGLGLKIVRQFLEEIGGQIYLTSELGKGTVFKVLIPYQLPLLPHLAKDKDADQSAQISSASIIPEALTTESAANVKPKKSSINQNSSKTNKILLVEDHPIAAKIAETILSELGCEVDIAETGNAALKLAEKNHYDLIFMDIGLPDIDGYSVTQQIRSHRLQSGAKIPIVALTAHAENNEKKRCLDVGMNMVITKPLTKEWAKSVLDTLIPKRKRYSKSVNSMQRIKTNKKRAEKIIDIEYAKTLLGDNETLVYEMLTMLVNSFPEEVKALEEAYQQKNWEELRNLVHKLKGGSSYCGTLRLKSACGELEGYIKSGLTAKIPELYQKLLSEVETVKKVFKN